MKKIISAVALAAVATGAWAQVPELGDVLGELYRLSWMLSMIHWRAKIRSCWTILRVLEHRSRKPSV